MTKYLKTDVTEEEGVSLLSSSLDRNFFLFTDFSEKAGKDRHPDMDGLIRLRDGKGNYLSLCLHYQLKSVSDFRNNKYPVDKETISYLISTNVPTILIVADLNTKRVFWLYLDSNETSKEGIRKGRGKTLSFVEEISQDNSAQVSQKWQKIAKRDDYNQLNESLEKILLEFGDNLTKCIGLLHLLGRVSKEELLETFNTVLGIGNSEINLIIDKLDNELIISSTTNYYLLENEQLGTESLFELLDSLDLKKLDILFNKKNQEAKAAMLRRLSSIVHPSVSKYFKNKIVGVSKVIEKLSDSDKVAEELRSLKEFAHCDPAKVIKIIKFVLKNKTIPYERFHDYSNPTSQSLELLEIIRYYKSKEVFNLLIKLSTKDNYKEKSINVLEHLCEYNIFVLQKIGYHPQLVVLSEVEKWSDNKLIKNLAAILRVANKLLQPSFRGTSAKGNSTVIFHSGALIVQNELSDVRCRAIILLKYLYNMTNDTHMKKKVIHEFQEATHTSLHGSSQEQLEKLVLNDTNLIIDFYISIVESADNEIISEIEEHTFWFVRRFTRNKLERIKELESLIAGKTEYAMFSVFVGYESRFVNKLSWKEAEKKRKEKIQDFIKEVDKNNFKDWVSKIESVLKNYIPQAYGEYNYFNMFLFELGKQKPTLAARLIENNNLEPFLIHIVAGIWKSESTKLAKEIILDWVKKSEHLPVCARVFDYLEVVDEDLMVKILVQSTKKHDTVALQYILSSVCRNYQKNKILKPLFVKTIRELIKNDDHTWPSSVWYTKSSILKDLTKREYDVLLSSLIHVNQIDHKIEEILMPIAKRFPEKVISLFNNRISQKLNTMQTRDYYYDEIPFDFSKIGIPLSKNAKVVVPLILKWYGKRSKDYKWFYVSVASQLLHAIFPANIEGMFKRTLIDLIKTKKEKNVKIVFSILKEYTGQDFIYPIIIVFINEFCGTKKYKQYLRELFGILSITGVVSGNRGFIDAYNQKKESIQVLRSYKSKRIIAFIDGFEEYLDNMIAYNEKHLD